MSSFQNNTSLVLVTVQKLLPYGMQVCLEDGSTGIIREREVAWNHQSRRDWRTRFKVGDVLTAIPLGEKLDQRAEFSLRLAENDPWIDLTKRYPLGAAVNGTVTGVQNYGAFIEIEPGISGLLHATRLPDWAQRYSLKDLFWFGDKVKVIIEHIDPKNRRIGLNLKRVLSQRWPAAPEALDLPQPIGRRPTAFVPLSESAEVELPSWNIIVVEDDLVQLEAIARWMQQMGLDVRTASTAEAALAQIAQQQPDLVITDFGLPEMNGADAIRLIHRQWPDLHCALMTDWSRVNEYIDTIDPLRASGTQLLIKPLRPEDIIDLLTIGLDVAMEGATATVALNTPVSTPVLLQSQIPVQRRIKDLLLRLCATTSAVKVVIFGLDPAQRQVSIVSEAGPADLDTNALVDLIHSPVRDVAEDHLLFRVEDTLLVESRVRYLKPLLPFDSCLGVRLPAQLPESYALFLFSVQPNAFQDLHEAHAIGTSLAVAALLEHKQFQHHMQEIQRVALLGQLSRGLVHEINHQLSPINFVVSDIDRQVGLIKQSLALPPEVLADSIAKLHAFLQELHSSVERLTNTARMFGQLTIQTREQVGQLSTVIMEVSWLLRDLSDRAHVQLDVVVPNNLPSVPMQPAQVQQMLLNLGINAIQHIELMRSSTGGRLRISVDQRTHDQQPVICITLADDGPGIHRKLWKRIFDLGFTTRAEGGSGMGLFIARSLAEGIGGRIYVEESYILWGSVFVIELPVDT